MSFTDAPDFDTGARERDGAIPRFYVEAYRHEAESAAKGSPVYKEREMVEILIPGDRKSISNQIVGERHRMRWPREYAAFKAGQEAPLEGTPVSELPGIGRAQAEELSHHHVKTIEALAGLPDELLNKVVSMGGFALRDKARRWLEVAAGEAPTEKLAAENRAQAEKMAVMEREMTELRKAIAAMQAQQSAGPSAQG
jgi:hypothetical protein